MLRQPEYPWSGCSAAPGGANFPAAADPYIANMQLATPGWRNYPWRSPVVEGMTARPSYAAEPPVGYPTGGPVGYPTGPPVQQAAYGVAAGYPVSPTEIYSERGYPYMGGAPSPEALALATPPPGCHATPGINPALIRDDEKCNPRPDYPGPDGVPSGGRKNGQHPARGFKTGRPSSLSPDGECGFSLKKEGFGSSGDGVGMQQMLLFVLLVVVALLIADWAKSSWGSGRLSEPQVVYVTSLPHPPAMPGPAPPQGVQPSN